METIEEIIEHEISEPLVEEPSHHTHHAITQHHRTHRHHPHHHQQHNGSVVMVTQSGQIVQHQRHEMNNNGQLKKYFHISII